MAKFERQFCASKFYIIIWINKDTIWKDRLQLIITHFNYRFPCRCLTVENPTKFLVA